MPESIQDYLVSQGYAIDEENGFFRKYSLNGDLTKIPFSAIAKTGDITSFKALASKEGWVSDNQPKSNAEMATALQQLQKAWGYTGPFISVDMTKDKREVYRKLIESLRKELKRDIFLDGQIMEWSEPEGEANAK